MKESLVDKKAENGHEYVESFTRYSLVELDRFLSPNVVLNSTSAFRTPCEATAHEIALSPSLNTAKQEGSPEHRSSPEMTQVEQSCDSEESEEVEEVQDIDVLYEDSKELDELKRQFFFSQLVEVNVREYAQQERARLEAFHEQLFSLIPKILQTQSLTSIWDKNSRDVSASADNVEYSRLFNFFMVCSTPVQHCVVGEARRVLEDVEKNILSLDTHAKRADPIVTYEKDLTDMSPTVKKWRCSFEAPRHSTNLIAGMADSKQLGEPESTFANIVVKPQSNGLPSGSDTYKMANQEIKDFVPLNSVEYAPEMDVKPKELLTCTSSSSSSSSLSSSMEGSCGIPHNEQVKGNMNVRIDSATASPSLSYSRKSLGKNIPLHPVHSPKVVDA